ncbi:MAG: TetR/AcrR family transcriptional regulator [Burkholderiales bacterium]
MPVSSARTKSAVLHPEARETGKPSNRARRIKPDQAGSMREEVNAYKKDLILRAACETFYDHGYHDTTVDMLAARLSGTKAIFYYYYPDKRAVLDELFSRTFASALEVLHTALEESGTPTETLTRFARRYTEWVIDNQKFVAVFWREECTISKELRITIARQQKRFDDGVATIIRRGVACGEFDSKDPQSTSRAISGMLSFMYTWWRDGRRISRKVAADDNAELILRMVRKT